jgi:predicted nucleotidyltransferase
LNPLRCGIRFAAIGALLDDAIWLWQHELAMASDLKALNALAERERVLRILRERAAALQMLGVSHLWLFGSLARGEAGEDSDVDMMIAIPRRRKVSLFDLGEVRVELCDLLGREVDVVIEQDLVPEFHSDVFSDLVQVF